jgi:hypothetical protein
MKNLHAALPDVALQTTLLATAWPVIAIALRTMQ